MYLSLAQKVSLLFSRLGFFLLFWAVFTLIGGIAVWNTDWTSLFWDKASFETTQGRLIEKENSNFTVNDEQVWAYRYVFELDQKRYEGLSYGSHSPDAQNDAIQIQYLPSNPDISCIVGMRREQVPKLMGILAFVFMVLPVQIWLFYIIFKVDRIIQILKKGRLAEGSLKDSKVSNPKIRDKDPRNVYKLSYYYSMDGKTHKTHVSSRDPAGFQDTEWLFYDPDQSKRTVFVNTLPASIQENVKEVFLNKLGPKTIPQGADPQLLQLSRDFPSLQFQENEQQLWAGKALPTIKWEDVKHNPSMTFVGLFFMGFVVFLIMEFWGIPIDQGAMILYSAFALFFGAGLWMSVGRFLHIYSRRKRTRYVLSNQQLIVIQGHKARGLNLKTIDDISYTVRRDGSGIISFGKNYDMEPVQNVTHVFNIILNVNMMDLVQNKDLPKR